MKLTALAVAAPFLFPCVAQALLCTPVEYAQYKDQATTVHERRALADKYCLYKKLQRSERSLGARREVEACDVEMTKILDAINSKKDNKTVAYALGGCDEPGK